ncbi:MAG: hypothetical protein D6796_13265 [Caldilineae bacterium]|nr:MAG: hypothetical protein D6796_13265 [Caldilineae bacterium]
MAGIAAPFPKPLAPARGFFCFRPKNKKATRRTRTDDRLILLQWDYPAVCLLGTHLKREHRFEFAHARRLWLVFDTGSYLY